MVVARPGARTPGEPLPGLLLIDDDALIVDALSLSLGSSYDVVTAGDRAGALQQMRVPAPPALVLLDLGLPPAPHAPTEGLALITEMLAVAPRTRIIVMSGQGGRAAVREALALGAADFIAKPCDQELLLSRLGYQRDVLEAGRAGGSDIVSMLVGRSRAMDELRACIGRYAAAPAPGAGGGRVRHRQRAGGALPAPGERAQRWSLPEAELRGAARGTAGGGTVRPCAWRVHRRGGTAPWFPGSGQWRQPAAGRGRRVAVAPAGQVVAAAG